MKTSLKNLKTYAGFARRVGRRFVAERLEERRISMAPAPHRPTPGEWRDDRLTVAWLGHATVLMNFYGTWLLTDPALRSRVGVRVVGGMMLGPRRLVEPALTPRDLPPLDAVLISHAHMDHCDLGTLNSLPRATRAVVQRGNLDLVRRFTRADELAWGDSVMIGEARVTAVEVNHWGARKLTDRHRGYGGFLIEKKKRAVLFGGDTAYTDSFSAFAGRVNIDLAILPIGAYDPYIYAHANPEQAWTMAREMGATWMLPIHHATFRLSREPADEPIRRLLTRAGAERWRVALSAIGETWVMPEEVRSKELRPAG